MKFPPTTTFGLWNKGHFFLSSVFYKNMQKKAPTPYCVDTSNLPFLNLMTLTIHGHFLICYLSTVLARILQIYELRDEDSMQEIFNFFREFKLVEVGNKYINMATKKEFIVRLKEQTKLPLTNAILSKNQYKKIMDYEI